MLEDLFLLVLQKQNHHNLNIVNLVLTLVIIYLMHFLYSNVKSQWRKYKLSSTMQGPKAYPLIGNVLSISESKSGSYFENKTSKLIKRNSSASDIVRIWIFHNLFVLVKDPIHAQDILRSTAFRKNEYYRTLFCDTALGQGLLTNVSWDTWRRHRKIITPTFHFNILHTYITYFYEETQILCNLLGEMVKTQEEIEIDMKLKLAGFDMIVRNVLGVQINAQSNPQHPFLMNMIDTMQLTQLRLYQPWLLNDTLFRLLGHHTRQMKSTREINSFIKSVITMKRKEYENERSKNNIDSNNNINNNSNEYENDLDRNKCGMGQNDDCKNANTIPDIIENGLNQHQEVNASNLRSDENQNLKGDLGKHVKNCDEYDGGLKTKSFLELLLEMDTPGDKLTDEEILSELSTLFFAALDTTSTSNGTALLLLAMHPDVLQKVTEEIDSIFGGPDYDDGRKPTPVDLSNLNYLECVLKENSRMYPAAPTVFRQVDEEVPLGKHILPAGTSVAVVISGIHRNPLYWQSPRRFIPDRFSSDESISGPFIRQRHPYAYIPFSAGPRNCVGQKYAMLQMKTVISTILRRFHLVPSPLFQKVEDIDKRIRMDITLRLEEATVILKERRRSSNVH
uniref:Cytochrome P450 4g15 n=1 Tax=Cacopsylla melanoneura TaxID=428564 RepID=A0A8D8SJ62_9HEMI